jgi:predicted CoA-binding protein
MNSSQTIEKILAMTKTIAVVGFSASQSRAGYYVPAYLKEQGYRIIPVNPHIQTGLDQKAYPNLLVVPEPIDLALIFRQSWKVPPSVEEAIKIGAKAVWMQLGIVNETAAARARAAGLDVVVDACMLVEYRKHKNR